LHVRNTTSVFFTALLACVILSAQPSQSQTGQWLAQNGPPPAQQTQTQPEMAQPTVPRDDVLLILIRATLIALNQANVTGNYTVLRDLGAPGFKENNSANKLAQVFASIRQRNLDLALVLLVEPKLYRKPAITPKGLLRITGFFPTDRERINFDLMFQSVEGRWRLFGISADAASPEQAPASQAAPHAAPAKAPEEAARAKPATEVPKKPKAPSHQEARPIFVIGWTILRRRRLKVRSRRRRAFGIRSVAKALVPSLWHAVLGWGVSAVAFVVSLSKALALIVLQSPR
jgi:hypothetical protein